MFIHPFARGGSKNLAYYGYVKIYDYSFDVGTITDIPFDDSPTTYVCTFEHETEKVQDIAHGLTNGTKVMFSTTGTLPAALDSSTIYYVVNTDTDDFEISLEIEGSHVILADNGTGTHSYFTPTYLSVYEELTNPVYSPVFLPDRTVIYIDWADRWTPDNGGIASLFPWVALPTTNPTYPLFDKYAISEYSPTAEITAIYDVHTPTYGVPYKLYIFKPIGVDNVGNSILYNNYFIID